MTRRASRKGRSETGTFFCPICGGKEHSRTNLRHHIEAWHGKREQAATPERMCGCGERPVTFGDRCLVCDAKASAAAPRHGGTR